MSRAFSHPLPLALVADLPLDVLEPETADMRLGKLPAVAYVDVLQRKRLAPPPRHRDPLPAGLDHDPGQTPRPGHCDQRCQYQPDERPHD